MRSLTINKNNIMKNSLFLPVILFLVMILINSVMQPNLFKASVIRSNILTFSPLILVAMGQSIIMIAGNLDLSVGFGVSLLNCFLAMTLRVEPGQGGYNTLILGLGLLIAVVMGVVNGFIVGYLKIPSFIATFATSFIWWGTAINICPVPGGAVPRAYTKFFKAHLGPINVMLLLIIVTVIIWILFRKRKAGRYLFAVGSNKEAASANGIPVNAITYLSFALGWVFVYLGTIALSVQTRSGDAAVGDPYALNSIAAAVVGGIAMTGGKGSPVGAILGAITLSIIMNIIYFSGLPTSYQILVRGIIIILALGATIILKRKEHE